MADFAVPRLDRYELRERIGTGGTARVYKAYDTTLDRIVAIKILYEHLAKDTAFQERFEREAKIVASFNHPNIVQVYDFSAPKGMGAGSVYYMVMSYIPGHTLRQELELAAARENPLNVPRVVQIMRDVANALGYAHDHGMVHRDVKPGNILIRPDGSAVLTDFGIARMVRAERLTQQGTTSGTPVYMSPEQANGEAGDNRSDLYALAIILYEMVAGQPPFNDDNTLAVMLKHMNAPVPPLAVNSAGFDISRMQAFLDRALAKNPAERFQTAEAFMRSFDAIFATAGPHTDDAPTELLLPSLPRQTREAIPSPTPEEQTPPRFMTGAFTVKSMPTSVAVAGLVLIVALIAIMIFTITRGMPGASSSILPPVEGIASMTGSLYFTSEFTPGDPYSEGWPVFDDGRFRSEFTADGFYRLESLMADQANTRIYMGGGGYEEVSITLEGSIAEGSLRPSAFGIVFRYQDASNYNVFAVDGEGRYSIWVLQAGQWRELRQANSQWTPNDAIKPIGQTNRLAVTLVGDEITGYVNSRSVVSLTETTFSSGGIGIYTASDNGPAVVLIDTFRVFSSVPSMTSPSG